MNPLIGALMGTVGITVGTIVLLSIRASNLAVPVSVPVVKLRLGINVAASVYYSTERTFANLAFAAGPWLDSGAGFGPVAADKLEANGYPKISGVLALNVPQPVWSGVSTAIRCEWKGSGAVRVDGDRVGEVYGDHNFTVTWKGFSQAGGGRPSMLVYATGISVADPLHDLDCREAGLTTAGALGQFDQRLVDDLKPFGVLRFLDWSTTNTNPASVTWGARTLPGNLTQNGGDGIAIEHMVDLANAAGSDAWFAVPYNADADYVQHMGQMVHDRLAPGHRAYFELSNEIWNFQFSVATQALNEGLAENLSPDKYTNHLYRYAEKSTWMHKILTDVFRDNPARLVRVVSAQNSNPWVGQQIMGFKDMTKWVDALATAPYFGHSFFDGARATVTDLPTLFADLETLRAETIAQAVTNKATATQYGKRYIAYEGGQHIIATQQANAATAAQMERSPLMYDMYKRYLNDWNTKIADTMAVFSATGQISKYGAWGIREYAGQPLSETPKRRAVLESK
jgi:hypothetical protein